MDLPGSGSERHCRRRVELCAPVLIQREEDFRRETESTCKERGRYRPDGSIVLGHSVVEEPARGSDFVLDRGEIALEGLEIRARLEVGIGFSQGYEPPELGL